MNTITHQSWKPRLYLDALGSASVIATCILIFLAAAAMALSDGTLLDAQVVESCPTGRFAAVEYADQRPGAAQAPDRATCA